MELVRYQKQQALPMAAGAEEVCFSSKDILESERNRHGMIGKYMDAMSHTMRLFAGGKNYILRQIWDL